MDHVARGLERAGWEILARNARPAEMRGESDIVARDRREIVFVEVKARTAGAVRGPETPLLSVGPRTRWRLRALAGAWLREPGRPGGFGGIRFDVVGVWLAADASVLRCEYVRGAF